MEEENTSKGMNPRNGDSCRGRKWPVKQKDEKRWLVILHAVFSLPMLGH